MSDILKGLTGAGSVFLFAWILPCALAVGGIAFFLMPWLVWVPASLQPARADFTKMTIILAFTAVGVGILMSGLQTQLYRALEWYAMPGWLRSWGVKRARARKEKLKKTLAAAQAKAKELKDAGKPYTGWEETLLEEQLGRFPIQDREIAPSRLANALRAFETYGWDRYQLDSQTLWTELLTLVPEPLRKELDQSRAGVDFLVALVYLTILIGFGILSGLIGRGSLELKLFINNWGFLAAAAIAFLLARLWYRAAVGSSSYWYSTVQALVNIGRVELAESLGLQMPATLEEERTMWAAVSDLVIGPYSDRAAKALDPFRANTDPPTDPPRGGIISWLRGNG
jgi:hypothetical protein